MLCLVSILSTGIYTTDILICFIGMLSPSLLSTVLSIKRHFGLKGCVSRLLEIRNGFGLKGCVYRLLEIRNGYLSREQKRRYDPAHKCSFSSLPCLSRGLKTRIAPLLLPPNEPDTGVHTYIYANQIMLCLSPLLESRIWLSGNQIPLFCGTRVR